MFAPRRSLLKDRAAVEAMEEEGVLPETTVEYAPRPQLHLSLIPFEANSAAGVMETKVRSLVERLGGQIYPEPSEATTDTVQEGPASNTLRISLPGKPVWQFPGVTRVPG
ncbi:MAG: hypothetical protein R3231_02740 [bacterium]|nr:hypothetical protein [bacterium]